MATIGRNLLWLRSITSPVKEVLGSQRTESYSKVRSKVLTILLEWGVHEQYYYCHLTTLVWNVFKLAEISVVVVDTDEKCNQLLDRSPKCLRRMISIRGVRPSTNQKARNRGVEILTFDEVEKSGASKTFSEQVNIIKL